MMPKGRPHPGRPYRGRMYLQDTADDSAIGDDVEIVVIPLAGGAARCSVSPSACLRGLPFALLRFAANGTRVQHFDAGGGRRPCRSALARWASSRGGQLWTCVNLGEALLSLDVLASCDDAIGERDIAGAALQFAHLEPRGGLVAHTKPAAIVRGRDEHVIFLSSHHLGEIGIELHDGATALELRRTKILEPKLRALHAIEQALRTVGKRHGGALRAAHREIAGHDDIAQESASKGDVVSGLADDADV